MLSIETAPFEAPHAGILVEMAERAFAALPREARPKDTPAFVGHLHGSANPAGRAWVALARLPRGCVGSVSAIPSRFRTRDGRAAIGWQIGFFSVDPSVQRQGIGGRLLEAITGALRPIPGSFIYTYPNQRSIHVFDRQGYVRLASIPTWVHLPTLASLVRGGGSVRDGAGSTWDLEIPGASDAGERIFSIAAPPPSGPGFCRDALYFRWRFCGPGAERRYTFALCRSREGGEALVVALARHRFKGIRFAILVDGYPDVLRRRFGLAVRAAQAAARCEGAHLVYVNTNLASLPGAERARAGAPWSVRVPQGRNPRPIELLMHPDTGAIEPRDLAESLVMTADWMGF